MLVGETYSGSDLPFFSFCVELKLPEFHMETTTDTTPENFTCKEPRSHEGLVQMIFLINCSDF